MKFTATIREYEDFGEHKDKEVEFDNVKSFSRVDGFFIITSENGDEFGTSQQVIKYSLTKENN